MNEFALIERLAPLAHGNASVVAGIGHDCAVVEAGLTGEFLLLKTDATVEGIHFTPETEPERVGHKALARCLSDIAAAAGTPTHALVTLGLPRAFDPTRVEGLYRGMNALAARYDVAVVGGETVANPERMFISVAVLGRVPKKQFQLRSGARAGDAIFVTGELGGSILGRHLDFEPRLREARWLVEHFDLHAMMDLSDGLAGDIRHLLKASGVGAELRGQAIPVSRAARQRARAAVAGPAEWGLELDTTQPALLAALTDGEDFELLFTVAPSAAVPLLDAWKQQFPAVKLSCIGRITQATSLLIRDRRGLRPLDLHGYSHFQNAGGN